MDEGSASFRHLAAVRAALDDPAQGLPDPVFDFVRQVTPLVNVDLLVRDSRGAVLLTWRADRFYTGWHVPGGIVRFRETAAARIAAVAHLELDAAVETDGAPCDIREHCGEARGHFVALLFRCTLLHPPGRPFADPAARPTAGALGWFEQMPDDIIALHRDYARWFAPSSAQTAEIADDVGHIVEVGR